ncbi:MAG: hypothetical protein ABR589_00710 [Chthoniobacterales bacterium]
MAYVDEGHVLHQVLHILRTKSLDTGSYGYPSLPAYLITATVICYAPVYVQVHGHNLWQDLPTEGDLHTNLGAYYDLVFPQEIIWLARVVVLIFSLGTVL